MFTLCFGVPVVGCLGSIGGWRIFIPLALVWGGIFYLLLSVKAKKIKKAREVYLSGRETTIYFQGLDYNYNVKVNGAPQPVVLLRIGGETIRVKSFSRRVINAFSVPEQKAYVLDKYPDIILPEALVTGDLAAQSAAARSINM